MRALIKLSILIAITLGIQGGLHKAQANAAEARFECQIMWARLRGVPIDAPELLDLAEPLIGCAPIAHGVASLAAEECD